jgi:hypothetical protein
LQLRPYDLSDVAKLTRDGTPPRIQPMPFSRNFRFLNDRLNILFIHLLIVRGLRMTWDENGVVYFDANDEETVEDILATIRNSQFSSWQILSCPSDWVNKYRSEMKRRQVPFVEELNDGQVEFLLPGDQEPHDWKFATT